jgi:hypothetical protein
MYIIAKVFALLTGGEPYVKDADCSEVEKPAE